MPLVTTARRAEIGSHRIEHADRVGGRAEMSAVLGGVRIVKRLRATLGARRPLDRGVALDLDANTRIEWQEADGLAAFETFPGELAYLATGAHVSIIRLSRVPDVCEWVHDLSFPPGTQFVYQGELTPGELADGAVRPRAIVGSYAVRDAAGAKLAQIPCPVAVDARGEMVSGTIRIRDGVSRVTFDPAILRARLTGEIEVRGGDTFGYYNGGTPGGTSIESTVEYVHGYGPWQAAAAGTLTAIDIYMTGLSSNNCTFGLYDSDGAPNNRLAQHATGEVESDGWCSQAVSYGSLAASTNYWFVQNKGAGGAPRAYYDAGTKNLEYAASAYSAGNLPATYPASTNRSSRDYSAYGTYTPSGGGFVPYPYPLHDICGGIHE